MHEYHNIDSASLNRPDNYSGYWEVLWPNGKLKYRGHFVDGVEVGQQVCFWDDGTIAQIGWRDSTGCPRGTTVSFYPDGDKETEEAWDDESRHRGSFVSRVFDSNGDVVLKTSYREFQVIETWEKARDAETQELWESIGLDQIVEDAVKDVTKKLSGRRKKQRPKE